MSTSDFDTDHLTRGQRKIANVVKRVLGKDASNGGCKAFYTPKEWEERGESYGTEGALILVHDGGDLAPHCNLDYGCYSAHEKLTNALSAKGFRMEQCTSWYTSVYVD